MAIRHSIALVLGVLFCCSSATEQSQTPDQTPDLDPDSQPATQTLDCDVLQQSLDDAVTTTAAGFTIPGALVFLKTPSCGTISATVGLAVLEPETPVSADMVFQIGSITKTFVAALVLRLVEDEILSLTDTLDRWRNDIPNAESITLRHLLNHTSGVTNYVDVAGFRETAMADLAHVWTPDELISWALRDAPTFAPGEDWSYSNTNYILLGLIVEAVTGDTIGNQLRQRVLDPLGLEHTVFVTEQAIQGELMHPYFMGMDFSVVGLSWTWAAAGMVSSAEDLLNGFEALLVGEFLSETSLEAMLTLVDTGTEGIQFGLGVMRIDVPGETPGPLVGNNGRGPGVMADAFWALELGVWAVVYVNADGVFTPEAQGASMALLTAAFGLVQSQ